MKFAVISLIAFNDRRAGKWGDLTETEIAHAFVKTSTQT